MLRVGVPETIIFPPVIVPIAEFLPAFKVMAFTEVEVVFRL
jgi:hypothetical protein